jgi:uncharacterized protein YpuA (DUF1002 family)
MYLGPNETQIIMDLLNFLMGIIGRNDQNTINFMTKMNKNGLNDCMKLINNSPDSKASLVNIFENIKSNNVNSVKNDLNKVINSILNDNKNTLANLNIKQGSEMMTSISNCLSIFETYDETMMNGIHDMNTNMMDMMGQFHKMFNDFVDEMKTTMHSKMMDFFNEMKNSMLSIFGLN